MNVILDSDVAELYQVETKRINEAMSRNENKFPEGYVIQLTTEEKDKVVAICDHLKTLKFSKASPKAFTEKGLYMLATILKSPVATKTTLLIIDTFAKVRELDKIIDKIQMLPEDTPIQKTLMARTGDLIADLIAPAEELTVTGTETIL
ncbi:MAG: ORF6N domain-containing protein, partial [Gammaproteobacteria bacterium]|nr:ORF6N domain-containing protein [Gammaproteobacteria bacterium]